MWRIPSPLIASGSQSLSTIITAPTYIGDLYTYLGSPTGIVDVSLTIDGTDVADIQISNSFATGSTFEVICTNGGRVLGLGGNGGNGGNDLGATGTNGAVGSNGGHAITTTGFTVNVDIDDGYLFGGGGGGGGGGFDDLGTTGNPGGGGGGGQGYTGGDGGTAGTYVALPSAANGAVGTLFAAGSGGSGGTPGTNDGGNGGGWGSGGNPGGWGFVGVNNNTERGGVGGTAGQAVMPLSGGVVSWSGVKSETTLRSEGRVKGETNGWDIQLPSYKLVDESVIGASTHGFTFQSDGKLSDVYDGFEHSFYWSNAKSAGRGTNYEVRIFAPYSSGWPTSPGADGTFFSLATDKTWSFSSSGGIQ